jgi:hypothetical protein
MRLQVVFAVVFLSIKKFKFCKTVIVLAMCMVFSGCSIFSNETTDSVDNKNGCASYSINNAIDIGYEEFTENRGIYQVFIKVKKKVGGYGLKNISFNAFADPYIDIWIMQREHSDYFDSIFKHEDGHSADQYVYAVVLADHKWFRGGYCIRASYEDGRTFRDAAVELRLK